MAVVIRGSRELPCCFVDLASCVCTAKEHVFDHLHVLHTCLRLTRQHFLMSHRHPARSSSLHSVRSAKVQRRETTHGTVGIPRSHIHVVDPHDVPGGLLPIHVRGWLLLRNSRLGPQERAAILSATSGETSFSNVSEKLRSQWSGADLASCDRHGARKGLGRRHGNAHHDIGSDDDGDDMTNSQDQSGESHDGPFGSDDVDDTVGAIRGTFRTRRR